MPDQQLSSKGVSATTEPVKRKLPFDPISLVVRLLLAIYVPVFLGVGTGVFAYRTVKSRPPSFESSAVCLIDLKVQGMAQGYQPTSPSCIIGMFTLPSTFRRVASRLNGEYDAGELAGMVTVDHDRKSKMITVTATASSAEAAADLANAVIEVTGERIILDRFEASRQACTHFVKTEKELNERLQKVEQKLKELGEVDINVTVSETGKAQQHRPRAGEAENQAEGYWPPDHRVEQDYQEPPGQAGQREDPDGRDHGQ